MRCLPGTSSGVDGTKLVPDVRGVERVFARLSLTRSDQNAESRYKYRHLLREGLGRTVDPAIGDARMRHASSRT